jgi:undecaprenyl-diphosphatase
MTEKLGVIKMIEELLKYDTELFLFLNSLGNETWDGFWLIVTEKWSSTPLYAILLYLIYKKYDLKRTIIIVITVTLLITATDQLANLFKYGIQRSRPCQLDSLQSSMRFIAERCGRFGFFSAHAANTMAVAVFIGILLRKWYPNLIFGLLFWAAFVAYSRIYLGVHYPLDIIAGMFFGSILGWAFYHLQHWFQKKFNFS